LLKPFDTDRLFLSEKENGKGEFSLTHSTGPKERRFLNIQAVCLNSKGDKTMGHVTLWRMVIFSKKQLGSC